MKVSLGKFALFGIESRLGTDASAAVDAALLHYIRRLRSARAPLAPPRFCRSKAALDIATDTAATADTAATFELAVEPEMRAALAQEARRHQLPLGQVLTHAVFVYLADLDSACEGEPDAWRSSALGARSMLY